MSRRAQTLQPQFLEDKPSRGKCLSGLIFIWKIFTCLVSHVTLVLLVVCYCVGGAYLFQHLEKPHEIEIKKGIQNIRYNLTDKIWKFSDNISVLSEDDWIVNVEKDLINFEKQILTAMKSDGWDGDEDITKTQWTFAGSLFYSIIVITTIGYGHISPHTDWGKVTTIFYAIMGIPLMLLCLSNIGDVMATSFRFIYWRVCCYICTRTSNATHHSRPRSIYSHRQLQYLPRAQQASIRRSNKRSAHNGWPHNTQKNLPHAHSDPELRHIGCRDAWKASRCDVRHSKNHRDTYEPNYANDCQYCTWDYPARHDHNELPRRHRRTRIEYDAHIARYSTRSERYLRPTLLDQPRYSYSLPRGRNSSRRMRARTVDPHFIQHQTYPHRYAPNYPHISIQPCESHRNLADEQIPKSPILYKRYPQEPITQHENTLQLPKCKLRSHSMPRAMYSQPSDTLYACDEVDEMAPPRKRKRAMSALPRNNATCEKGFELSEMRPPVLQYSLRPPSIVPEYAKPKSPIKHYTSRHISTHDKPTECRSCYGIDQMQYVEASYPHYRSHHGHYTRESHHSHASQTPHGARRARHTRVEKLPPSPRIMSPMGFAVKRQTRQRSSFDLDEDSLNGWHDPFDNMMEKNRPVPIWLCVFLVISYILAGAVLFAYWEKWSFLDSAYFCFITLTTIGFGDFVPAKGVKDESEQSIAYCSLYLLFGIALLAMSFNLVQEEFIANVKDLARRLGIIKEEEDDDK